MAGGDVFYFSRLKTKFAACLVFYFFILNKLVAQSFSTQHEKFLKVTLQPVRIDTLSIQPHSVYVLSIPSHQQIDSSTFSINTFNGMLEWKHLPSCDSIEIIYRTFPFNFSQAHQIRSETSGNTTFNDSAHEIIFHEEAPEIHAATQNSTLTYSGSFMRSFTAGSNQDLSFQSGFNLQLQGKIAGDVQVVASMTDKNLPIQPDGSTAQLQDFDNVFIQLRKGNQSLTLGDYHWQVGNSHFLSLDKSLKGISYQNNFSINKNTTASTTINFAQAKGKYARNEFYGEDFNQGPYRLKGNESEFYISIIGGSEKVYVDGQLMQRGTDRDYTIDYNTAEIVFTPLRLITHQSRIIVEFDYTNQSYLRSDVFLQQTFHSLKSDWQINFYNEQDAKNRPFIALSDSEKRWLSQASKTQQAFLPGADSVAFDAAKILYKKKDTLGYVIYVYSTNPDSARFSVQFADVGAQKGNYIAAQTLANGKVYAWIEPVKGVPQGEYEPLVPVSTPQKMQLITVGNTYRLNALTTISGEESFSRFSTNTFSPKAETNGTASFFSINKTWRAGGKTGVLNFMGSTEWQSKNFTTPERYQSVEFNRDWNLPVDSTPNASQLWNAQLSWVIHPQMQMTYHFSLLHENNFYAGYNHSFNGMLDHGRFQSNWNMSLLQSTQGFFHTDFFRPFINVSEQIGKMKTWEAGFTSQAEENKVHGISSDSLISPGYFWHQEKFYLNSHDSSAIHSAFDVSVRNNFSEINNAFKKNTSDFDLHEGLSWQLNTLSHFNLEATYHHSTWFTDSVSNQNNLRSGILAQASGDVHTISNWLHWNFLFQTGSVQQPKLEYAYIPVPAGQGIYTWIDFNHDGVQQQNEFVIAPFPDQATYIRIYIPSNEFTSGVGTQINQSLSLMAPVSWRNFSGIKKLASKFSLDANWQQNQTLNNQSWLVAMNPLNFSLTDPSLFYLQRQWMGTFYFNKTSNRWAADLNAQSATSKSLVGEGYQIVQSQNETLRARWNVHSALTFIAKASLLTKSADFTSSSAENFQWNGSAAELNSTYLIQTSLRINFLFRMEDWNDRLGDTLSDFMQRADISLRWNNALKGFLMHKFLSSAINITAP